MSKTVELTEAQKQQLKERCNDKTKDVPYVKELLELVFPGKNLDARSLEGKAIKRFIQENSYQAKVTSKYYKKDGSTGNSDTLLSSEQKELIDNHVDQHTCLEITQIVFRDATLQIGSSEFQRVAAYMSELGRVVTNARGHELAIERYKPPSTLKASLDLVNKFAPESEKIKKDIDEIHERDKKNLLSLIGYLNTVRFNRVINDMETKQDRELFLDTFVRNSHNKSDLTSEECDAYIILSSEAVIAATIQAQINLLQAQLDIKIQNGERLSQHDVELISKTRGEFNSCINRQQKLMNDLKQKRSDRLKNQIAENQSILQLVQYWKTKKQRDLMIKLAEEKKKGLRKEIDRISNLDDLKMQVWGLDPEELLNSGP